MNYVNIISDLTSKINSLVFQQYLSHKGWRKAKTKRPDVSLWESPSDDPALDIILPLSRSFADYAQAIHIALKKLASFEDRSEIQIANDLTAPPADIVRYRIANESTTNGIIPLKAGFDLLESAKKSLLSAASDVISPTHYHRRMGYSEALNFIDACYLGQSERGSYVTTIICPFIKAEENATSQLSLFSSGEDLSNSITRSVTKKLMNSLSKVKTAIIEGNIDSFTNAEEQDLVSANFLESIVEINEFTQNSTIEISTSWSPSIAAPEDVPNRVEITNDYIAPIKELIGRLRPAIEETQGDYVGKISAISTNPEAGNRDSIEIIFVFINEDEKIVNAKVVLPISDLHSVTRALEEGKNVRITGMLKVMARQKIIAATTFAVIQ